MRANSTGPPSSAALSDLSGRQDRRHIVVGFGNGFSPMGDSVAQRRQLDAIAEHDRLGKAQGPRRDALRNRTRIQADAGQLVPGKIARLRKREGPSTRDG
jgi:hypothetical protein